MQSQTVSVRFSLLLQSPHSGLHSRLLLWRWPLCAALRCPTCMRCSRMSRCHVASRCKLCPELRHVFNQLGSLFDFKTNLLHEACSHPQIRNIPREPGR